MQKQIIISLFLILFTVMAVNAQMGEKDADIRVGLGVSQFKGEEGLLLLSEYELNAKLSDYFTIAPSIILEHDANLDIESANFFQANLNAFGSPSRNDRQNDFRMGGGLSFYRLSQRGDYATRSALGLNLMLENTYTFNDFFLIGIKAFIQPYFNRDIHYGAFLKVGINL